MGEVSTEQGSSFTAQCVRCSTQVDGYRVNRGVSCLDGDSSRTYAQNNRILLIEMPVVLLREVARMDTLKGERIWNVVRFGLFVGMLATYLLMLAR